MNEPENVLKTTEGVVIEPEETQTDHPVEAVARHEIPPALTLRQQFARARGIRDRNTLDNKLAERRNKIAKRRAKAKLQKKSRRANR